MLILLPLPLSYYNRGRRRLRNKPIIRSTYLLTGLGTLFVLIMLPGGSISFPVEDEGLKSDSKVVPEESSLIRLARLSDNSSHTAPKDDDHLIEADADYSKEVELDDYHHNYAFVRNSKTENAYTGIPEDPPFHGEPCETTKDCYNLFGKSLECRDGTCQCLVWKGIKLKWTSKGNICLGATGHPCASKTMCHTHKCEKGHCVSGGNSMIPRNRRLLKEIVIHVSVFIVARFVLRLGV